MRLFELFGKRPAGRDRAACRPQLEALEGRDVPTVFLTALGGTLTIRPFELPGRTQDNDVVDIDDNGTAGAGNVVVRVGKAASTFNNISRIVVNSGRGDDTINYNLRAGLGVRGARDVEVSLGSGTDSFMARLGTNSFGASLDDYANLRVIASGGEGHDSLSGEVVGDLFKGSSLGFSFTGDGTTTNNGDDTFSVTATNDVDIHTGATLWMNLWGNGGQDNFFLNYRGELDGRLLLHLEGGEGVDLIPITFTLDSGSDGSVGDPNAPNDFQGNWNRFATVQGDGGRDEISFKIRNFGPTRDVLAQMFGGADIDLLERTANVTHNESDQGSVIVP